MATIETYDVARMRITSLFRSLNRAFRGVPVISNRAMIENAFEGDGLSNLSYPSALLTLPELDWALHWLEGVDLAAVPRAQQLAEQVVFKRNHGESVFRTGLVTCRWHDNGSLYFWLRQPGHVERINAMIAEQARVDEACRLAVEAWVARGMPESGAGIRGITAKVAADRLKHRERDLAA